LTLRGEYKPRLSENRALRRTFAPERKEVAGDWRKLRNDEINDFVFLAKYYWNDQDRRARWAGHVTFIVGEQGA
jgi:hypothetical protein